MPSLERIRRRLERAEEGLENLFRVADWYAEDVSYLLRALALARKIKEPTHGR